MVSLLTVAQKTFEKERAQRSSRYTNILRSRCIEAGWPLEAANALTVVYKDQSYTIEYPANMEDTVYYWEFGTQDETALPVMRNFLDDISYGRL